MIRLNIHYIIVYLSYKLFFQQFLNLDENDSSKTINRGEMGSLGNVDLVNVSASWNQPSPSTVHRRNKSNSETSIDKEPQKEVYLHINSGLEQ